mmetsp:Transcript_10114/g.23396  ORF Transcript_10114/g.23396 Transcript_10114/m.23396 type:complete len:221 (-) Transcript_10114:1591-2253(-)
MPNREPQLVHRKVAILGFRAVGKSSLTNAFVNGTFAETYDPTIESTHHKTIRFRKVHFATDIVDTAGMDEYSRLSRNASLGVHGYALVFSIVSRNSFERIVDLNDTLRQTLGDAPDVPRVLVGSMHDLTEQRQVSTQVRDDQQQKTGVCKRSNSLIFLPCVTFLAQDAQELAASWGVPYIECSSKTGENVAEVFHTLLKEIEKDEGLLVGESEEGGCQIL